ncbi:cytochrome P450 2J6-like [Paramacrobiotus metropolitanus]|uniref:cytochrome P450 2J6-like n=1 Tax=Paramacrobiotus metropolitanus TaxID=2943436 RepID=UPI002445EEF6|nr:cytochrome P450 2J6-like [Paramacrobiotus metropolitanus]
MIAELLAILPGLTAVVGIAYGIWHVWYTRPGLDGTPPGPMGIPFLGYLPFLGKYPWIGLDKLRKKYPRLVAMFWGNQYTVVLQDYEAVKAFLVEQDENFIGRPYGFLTKYFSAGKDGEVHNILDMEGPKWKATHDFVMDTYRELGLEAKKVDGIIVRQADHMITAFKRHNSGAFDPDPYVYPVTLNVLCGVMFGRELEFNGEEFKKLTEKNMQAFAAIAGSPIQQYPFLRYIPPFNKDWDALRYMVEREWELFTKEYAQHEQMYKDGAMVDFFDAYIRHIRGNDIKPSLAFQNKDDLICSTMGLWSAGPEATNVAILWAILFMTKYPEVQRRVNEEIVRVVGPSRPVVSRDQDDLPYTMATMYEFLRLGGNAPIGNPRSAFEESEVMGFRIPKRTQIIYNSWSIHRNPAYWDNPLVFNPERFLGSDGRVHVPKEFVAFGVGTRFCPGIELAKSLMFLVFANMMQQIEFHKAPGHELPPLDEYQFGVSCKPLPFKIRAIQRSY